MASSVLTCDRVRKGQPAAHEVHVSLQDDGRGLPSLYLFSDWSDRLGGFRTRDRYDVEEIPTGFDGRAFLLHRTPEAVGKDPEHVERYGVMVARNQQDHLCECRGHAAHGHCKHVDALRWVVGTGQLEDPGAGRPAAADAAVEEAPF